MNKKILYVMFTVLLIAAGWFVIYSGKETGKQGKKETVVVSIKEPKVKISLNDGKSISEDTVEALNVITALEKIAEKKGIKIQIKKYDFGSIVTSVGDMENNNSKAWFYKVNGKTAEVGADKYELKQDDKIEWYYEEIKF